MPDYSKSLIYTIRTRGSVYVGSTTNFTNRKSSHKLRIFKNIRNSRLYKTIRDNGMEWDMQPYKLFPCNNKLELTVEEERIRQELGADLNMVCCGSGLDFNDVDYNKKSCSLYHDTHKDELNKKAAVYREVNRDKIKKYRDANKDKLEIYNQANKDKIKKREANYREANRDEIYRKQKQKVTCECGCIVRSGYLPDHRKRNKHLVLMTEKIIPT